MPIQLNEQLIKGLNALINEADLVNKIFEVETPSGTNQNYKVSFPTVVQAVANNIPGGNNAKVAVKTVRRYSSTDPDYAYPDETLDLLNPDTLCLFTTCWVEFPHPTTEYILTYSANSALQVWRDGDFTGQKIGAQWVPVNSIQAQLQNIVDFNPFAFSYNQGENVKYTLDGYLRLFAAKTNLVKSTFSPQQIPAPTDSDPYWQEISAGNNANISDYLPGSYKRHDVVYFSGKLYRAKIDYVVGDYINNPGDFDNFPDEDYWLVIAGGSAPTYNDAPLKARVASLETLSNSLADTVEGNYNDLSTTIGNLHSTAKLWVAGSFVEGELVRYNNVVFFAKQAIQNSTIPPTPANTVASAFWGQVGGTGAAAQNSLTPASSTLAPTVDAVNTGLGLVSSYVDNQLADFDANYQAQITSVKQRLDSDETRLDNLEDQPEYTTPDYVDNAVQALDTELSNSIHVVKSDVEALDSRVQDIENYPNPALSITGQVLTLETYAGTSSVNLPANGGGTDVDAVHKTGDESITGQKTFTDKVTIDIPVTTNSGVNIPRFKVGTTNANESVSIGFEEGFSARYPRISFNTTSAVSANSGFVNAVDGVQQWFFGMSNEGLYGGTPGTTSGRFMGYYDFVSAYWRYGFNADGDLFVGTSATSYGVKLSQNGEVRANKFIGDGSMLTNLPVGVTQSYVDNVVANKANTVSPAFTGVPTAPTATTNSSSTQVANTAYVVNTISSKVPVATSAVAGTTKVYTDTNGTNTDGTVSQYALANKFYDLNTTTTTALANKADLVSGKVAEAQLPLAAFNSYGVVKISGSFFITNANGQLQPNFPQVGSTGNSTVVASGFYVYNGELYQYLGTTGSVSFTTFMANATKVIGIIDTTSTMRSAVVAGTFMSGELSGAQPSGSTSGMKFCDTNYRYEFMSGMNNTLVWVRTAKA